MRQKARPLQSTFINSIIQQLSIPYVVWARYVILFRTRLMYLIYMPHLWISSHLVWASNKRTHIFSFFFLFGYVSTVMVLFFDFCLSVSKTKTFRDNDILFWRQNALNRQGFCREMHLENKYSGEQTVLDYSFLDCIHCLPKGGDYYTVQCLFVIKIIRPTAFLSKMEQNLNGSITWSWSLQHNHQIVSIINANMSLYKARKMGVSAGKLCELCLASILRLASSFGKDLDYDLSRGYS